MDNIAGTKSSLTWAVHLSVALLVIQYRNGQRAWGHGIALVGDKASTITAKQVRRPAGAGPGGGRPARHCGRRFPTSRPLGRRFPSSRPRGFHYQRL